jgi:hypothetical protein
MRNKNLIIHPPARVMPTVGLARRADNLRYKRVRWKPDKQELGGGIVYFQKDTT